LNGSSGLFWFAFGAQDGAAIRVLPALMIDASPAADLEREPFRCERITLSRHWLVAFSESSGDST
jgi:hypothetical protein